MNISGTSILTWGLQWYILYIAVMYGYNCIAKSLKTQNCQKLLKLMIFRDSPWRFPIGFGYDTCLFML